MEKPNSHLFTLRVWREDLDDSRVEWRGQVKHVLSGDTRYFRDWSELRAFVRACLPGWKMEKGEGQEGKKVKEIE